MNALGGRWRLDASCTDVPGDNWFPPGRSTINPLVLRVCRSCPVWRDCLIYALGQPGLWDGIWAGLTPRELADLRARLLAGDLGADVVDEARCITDARGGVTIYTAAVPRVLPGYGELRELQQHLAVALTAAGLVTDSPVGAGRAA